MFVRIVKLSFHQENIPAFLENYRKSELFDGIWSFAKKLFNAKPEAWSVDKLVSLV